MIILLEYFELYHDIALIFVALSMKLITKNQHPTEIELYIYASTTA